ncbi:MAG: hypothetical protein OXE84_02915 [Rhodobacteraceae bacterium]|nr:hypothetical protein [Paracoccaceae bacterium]
MSNQPRLSVVGPEPPSAPKPPNGNGGNGNYGERLARIEARLESVAKREDIADLKTVIAEKDSARSKWLIGIMMTVVLAFVAGSITITVAMLKL